MEVNDKDIHDFRPEALKWGWNGLRFKITDNTLGEQKAEMNGINGNVRMNKYQYVLLAHGKQEVLWLIDDIKYERNPKDMFDAKLSYAGVPE